MTKRANTDMIEGLRDGYDLTAPEPSANRSASYRHGFMCGRLDKGAMAREFDANELRRLADQAMESDELDGRPFFECPGCGKDCADDTTSHDAACPRR